MIYDSDAALAKKPPHGSPCNGCGGCCMDSLCVLGKHVFGGDPWGHMDGPCPALTEVEGGKFGCGLIIAPQLYAPVRATIKGVEPLRKAALTMIGSGIGCDAQGPGEPPSDEFRFKMRAGLLVNHEEFVAACRTWGL